MSASTSSTANSIAEASDKSWLVTLILQFFLGTLGVHHFYVARTRDGFWSLALMAGFPVLALLGGLLVAVLQSTAGTSLLLLYWPLAIVIFVRWVMDLYRILTRKYKDAGGRIVTK